MADVVGATTPLIGDQPAGDQPVEAQPAPQPIEFRGTPRNLAAGAALLFGGLLAFSMGMTDVFFAEATAWTFVAWGVLLIYGGLLDLYTTYQVTDNALLIRNPLRPWGATKVWDWANVKRLDIAIKRKDGRPQDTVMQVYYNPEGELAMEREDRQYDPFLAQLIMERAGLRPADRANPKDLHNLPRGAKATFTWS
jgi:hypothetical protein